MTVWQSILEPPIILSAYYKLSGYGLLIIMSMALIGFVDH